MEDKKFTDGLIVKRAENAPEFVIANLSIKVDEFTKWLTDNQSNGWVNVNLLMGKPKDGKPAKPYGVLDTWKPKDEAPQPSISEEINDDLPF
jgi:hypothetical protein